MSDGEDDFMCDDEVEYDLVSIQYISKFMFKLNTF